MRRYSLRAGYRDANGAVSKVLLDEEVWAKDDAEAIINAKMFQVSRFLDHGDYAWLTDGLGHQIWSLTLDEAT